MWHAADVIVAAQQSLLALCGKLGLAFPSQAWLMVSIQEQRLYRVSATGEALSSYPISSAKKGVGNLQGSLQTPLGLHCIADKIGDGCAPRTVFKGRQPSGEMAELELQARATGEDCITSRILWLQGLEPGVNQGAEVDSYQRYIYIHGTHEEGLIGQPASIGCIRMCNKDVIELYQHTDKGSWVYILE